MKGTPIESCGIEKPFVEKLKALEIHTLEQAFSRMVPDIGKEAIAAYLGLKLEEYEEFRGTGLCVLLAQHNPEYLWQYIRSQGNPEVNKNGVNVSE